MNKRSIQIATCLLKTTGPFQGMHVFRIWEKFSRPNNFILVALLLLLSLASFAQQETAARKKYVLVIHGGVGPGRS
jgi:hypothetical protein